MRLQETTSYFIYIIKSKALILSFFSPFLGIILHLTPIMKSQHKRYANIPQLSIQGRSRLPISIEKHWSPDLHIDATSTHAFTNSCRSRRMPVEILLHVKIHIPVFWKQESWMGEHLWAWKQCAMQTTKHPFLQPSRTLLVWGETGRWYDRTCPR